MKSIFKFFGKVIAKLGWDYKRKLTSEEVESAHNAAKEGYIMCTFIPWQLSNIFIGSSYTHVEQLIGGGQSIGGLTRGVTKRNINEIISKCGRYVILKPKFASEDERKLAASRAREMERLGLEYDFYFSRENDDIYCSEVVVEGYIERLKGRYGQLIKPSELPLDTEMWEEVYSFSTK